MDGRLKQISHLCLDMSHKKLLLGTEGGNIYNLDLTNFKIEDTIIYQDIVIQNSTEEFKVNPGAVEALLVHPKETDKLLIGYARGLIVLWDRKEAKAEKTYYANQQLEAIGNVQFLLTSWQFCTRWRFAEFYLPEKIMKKFVKLCLQLSYKVQLLSISRIFS